MDDTNALELAGRTALITGASRGIGRSVAVETRPGWTRLQVTPKGAPSAASERVSPCRALLAVA